MAVWVNSFSVYAHFYIGMVHIYNEIGEEQNPHSKLEGEENNNHKEEGGEEVDWTRPIGRGSSHPLNDQQPGVYNISNGQVAPNTVSIQNALASGSGQSRQFSASLGNEFHKAIKKKVKTMELLKKVVTVKGKAIYNVETLFSWLLVV